MSKSNCTKVHPDRDPGPCSVPKCGIGKFDPSNRNVHFFQIMFTGNIIRLLILIVTCICRRCESALNFILKFKAGEPDEASDAKRACKESMHR